jgi:hypothetical protein
MGGAATVFDSIKIACLLRSLRKPKRSCRRTPPTLIYDLDRMDQDLAVVDRQFSMVPMDSHYPLSSSRKVPNPPCRRPKGCTIKTDGPPWMVPRRPLHQACPIR